MHHIEADVGLGPLLERVARGETLTITQNGKPVARLVPSSDADDLSPQAAMMALRAIRDELEARGSPPFTWDELKAYRDEGRR